MAEKNITIANAATGENVACYDSYDRGSVNPYPLRITQLVDMSQRKTGFNISMESGLMRDDVTTTDSAIFTTPPSGITDNLLVCGDKTTLVVACHYLMTDATKKLTLTPIIFDDNETAAVVGFLTPRVVSSYKPAGGTIITQPFYKAAGGNWNISEMLSWNVLGADQIGIHIACDSSNGQGFTADVYAAMITGPPIGEPAATALTSGVYSNYT